MLDGYFLKNILSFKIFFEFDSEELLGTKRNYFRTKISEKFESIKIEKGCIIL